MNRSKLVIAMATAGVLVVLALVSQITVAPSGKTPMSVTGPAPVALAQGVPIQNTAQQTGIAVSGQGRITVTPDLAQITLGVEVSDPSAVKAQQTAASQMDAVVAKLKELGVADKDIQTSRYDLSPEYDYSTKTPVLKGYRATNLVVVKIRDVSKVGPVLDAITSSGATRIQGISFSVSDPTAATTQGRDAAMKDARAKADQLAAGAGVSVGTPIYIEEVSSTPPPAVDIAPRAAPAAGAAPSTPISVGTQEVQVMVRVVFSIK